MKTEKLGQEPAFPLPTGVFLNYNENGIIIDNENGMSKRFYAACSAMHGLLTTGRYSENGIYNPVIAKLSFEIADELLKQEKL